MLIKLQPEQVSLFWDIIREGMIKSYSIPDKFAQEFAIHILKQFLVGDLQCWIGFELENESKVAKYFVATQIVDEKYLGIRSLYVVAFHSLIPVTKEIISTLYKELEPYAKSNNCKMALADYRTDRVKGFLLDCGFEPYKATARLMIGGN